MVTSQPKHPWLLAVCFCATILVAGMIHPSSANAAQLVREGSSVVATCNPDGTLLEKQGEDGFLAGLNLATAKISYSVLDVAKAHEFYATDPRFVLGVRQDTGDAAVIYNDVLATGTTTIQGECFTLVFPAACELSSGEKAAVRVSFSNMTFVNGSPSSCTAGTALTRGNNILLDAYTQEGKRARLAMQCDVSFSVDGARSSDVCVLSVTDLDSQGYEETGGSKYDESVQIKKGLASDVFVPASNYLVPSADNKRFSAAPNPSNGGRYADFNTFNSGFAALVKAQGFTLHWWGSCATNGTNFGQGLILKRITLKESGGGQLSTTSTGNPQIGDVLKTEHVWAAAGKHITFMLTADAEHELESLLCDGVPQEVEPLDNTRWIYELISDDEHHILQARWKSTQVAEPQLFADGPSTPVTQTQASPSTPQDTADITPLSSTTDSNNEPLYHVHFADGAHGTSTAPDQEKLSKGERVQDTNTVQADDGWEFTGTYSYTVTREGNVIEEGKVASVSSIVVTGDIEFIPEFAPIVSASSGAGGSVSPSGEVAVTYGKDASFTLTADEGFELASVTVNGAYVTAKRSNNNSWRLTLKAVKAPATLKVTWTQHTTAKNDESAGDMGYEDFDGQELITYTVTFKDPDGRTLKEDVVLAGTAATAPAVPKRVEEVFAYWDRRFDYVTSDMVVRAVYSPGTPYTPDYSLHGTSEYTNTLLPKTGDNSYAYLWLAVSALILLSAGIYLKRKAHT